MNKVTQEDLSKLDKDKLSKLICNFLDSLSPGERRTWIKENMAELLKTKSERKEGTDELSREIESFIKESHSGVYVSWENSYDYYSNSSDYNYENFEEWTDTFSDLLKRTMKISREGHHAKAVDCFSRLFNLLKEAGETTDILGDQGAPADAVSVDFSKAIAYYTKSLIEAKGEDKFKEVLKFALPIAAEYHYSDGYRGLVSVLNSEQRKILAERLWEITESEWRAHNERSVPDEVDGLIAIAEAEGESQDVLAIKEQFAKANTFYLKDVLGFYKEKRDWDAVAKWAKVGLTHFGQHKEYSEYLASAKENIGDKEAVLEARLNYFLGNSGAEEFENVRQYAESISKWGEVFKTIIVKAEEEDRHGFKNQGLKIKILLSEGHEKDAFEYLKGKSDKFYTELIKLIAKYGAARCTAGMELSGFSEIKTLERRLKKEKSDLYNWLRLIMTNPPKLKNCEYAELSVEMYRILIDFHLTSGKSSRAAYAGYYCSVVKELSDLLSEPQLWQKLLNYMMQRYSKKKLIWEYLRKRKFV